MNITQCAHENNIIANNNAENVCAMRKVGFCLGFHDFFMFKVFVYFFLKLFWFFVSIFLFCFPFKALEMGNF